MQKALRAKGSSPMRYDSADNYQAGANVVVSNPSASHKVRAEDGDDVDVLKMAGELAVVSQWGYNCSRFIADEDHCNRQ